jgi:hypothetical protein
MDQVTRQKLETQARRAIRLRLEVSGARGLLPAEASVPIGHRPRAEAGTPYLPDDLSRTPVRRSP